MYRIFCVAVLGLSSVAMGAEQVVWQIGKPDHDYSEFACAGNYHAYAEQFGAKPIVFQIGRSTPGRDWPFIQPGPTDTWAPARGQPWTIRFEIAGKPRGLYTLRIEFADVQATFPPRYAITSTAAAARFASSRAAATPRSPTPAPENRKSWRSTCPAVCSSKGRTKSSLPAPTARGSSTTP